MAEADDSVYRLRDRPMIPPKPAGGGVAFTGTAADLVEGVYRARRLRDDAFGSRGSSASRPGTYCSTCTSPPPRGARYR
jgi:hypothetical protein